MKCNAGMLVFNYILINMFDNFIVYEIPWKEKKDRKSCMYIPHAGPSSFSEYEGHRWCPLCPLPSPAAAGPEHDLW